MTAISKALAEDAIVDIIAPAGSAPSFRCGETALMMDRGRAWRKHAQRRPHNLATVRLLRRKLGSAAQLGLADKVEYSPAGA